MKTYRDIKHSVSRTTLGLGLAVCTLLASGCDNGSDPLLPGDATDLHDTPLYLQEISLEAAGEEEPPVTRTAVNSWNNNTDIIGAVSYNPTNGYNDLTIHPYTYNSGWKSTDPVYLGVKTSDIYLYYPYNKDTDTDPRKIGMKIYPFSDPSSDKTLAWAKVSGKSSTDATIGAALAHAYSKLYLTITSKTGEMTGATVKSMTLAGYASTANLNLINGTCTSNGTNSFVYESAQTLNIATPVYLSVLIPPASDLADKKTPTLQVNVDDVILTCNLPKIIEPNQWYSVIVNITPRKIAVDQVQVRDWVKSSLEVESKPSI